MRLKERATITRKRSRKRDFDESVLHLNPSKQTNDLGLKSELNLVNKQRVFLLTHAFVSSQALAETDLLTFSRERLRYYYYSIRESAPRRRLFYLHFRAKRVRINKLISIMRILRLLRAIYISKLTLSSFASNERPQSY